MKLLPLGAETFDAAKALSQKIANSGLQNNAFLLANEDLLEANCAKWTTQLPLIQPYFDVSCNACPWLLEALATYKVKFACNSKAEFQHVLGQGLSPADILFAAPVKVASHIKAAMADQIDLMAFDGVHELKKLAKAAPEGRYLMSLNLSNSDQDWPHLLKVAADLGVNVVGVAFRGQHKNLCKSVALARVVFAVAANFGHNMSIVDIGLLDQLDLEDLIAALEKHFKGHDLAEVIGHLGSTFIENVFTCGAKIIGKSSSALIINDGIFNSFGRLMADDGFSIESSVLALKTDEEKKACAKMFDIFGSSGDDMDVLAQDQVLDDQVEEEDWLYFPNMGAFSFGLEANLASVALPSKYGKFRMFTPDVSSHKPVDVDDEATEAEGQLQQLHYSFGLENDDEEEEVTVEVIFLDIQGSMVGLGNNVDEEERVNLFEELPNLLLDSDEEHLWEEFFTNLY